MHRHHVEIDHYVVTVPAGRADRAYADELLATGDYAFVEPDWRVYATAIEPDDPLLSLQWHHAVIDSCGAWALTTGDQAVVVAVCDSGVDTDHPELESILVPGFNAPSGIPEALGGAVEGLTDHGTQVAAAAMAVGDNGVGIAGVGWNLRLMPVRVMNTPGNTALVSDLNGGARWAVDNGARVVNVSFSNPVATSVLRPAMRSLDIARFRFCSCPDPSVAHRAPLVLNCAAWPLFPPLPDSAD